jgi:hypothetical protein
MSGRVALPLLGCDAHQFADAVDIERDEGILFDDAFLLVDSSGIGRGVVARNAEGGLGQVVGAEGEELGHFGNIAGPHGGARQLDHGADEIGDVDAGLADDFAGDGIDPRLSGNRVPREGRRAAS